LICFHLEVIYHIYVKRKHATPANIHTEVACSSLNNWEDTSEVSLSVLKIGYKKVSKVYSNTYYSLFCFCPTKPAACQVKHLSLAWHNYDRLIEKKYLQACPWNIIYSSVTGGVLYISVPSFSCIPLVAPVRM